MQNPKSSPAAKFIIGPDGHPVLNPNRPTLVTQALSALRGKADKLIASLRQMGITPADAEGVRKKTSPEQPRPSGKNQARDLRKDLALAREHLAALEAQAVEAVTSGPALSASPALTPESAPRCTSPSNPPSAGSVASVHSALTPAAIAGSGAQAPRALRPVAIPGTTDTLSPSGGNVSGESQIFARFSELKGAPKAEFYRAHREVLAKPQFAKAIAPQPYSKPPHPNAAREAIFTEFEALEGEDRALFFREHKAILSRPRYPKRQQQHA